MAATGTPKQAKRGSTGVIETKPTKSPTGVV